MYMSTQEDKYSRLLDHYLLIFYLLIYLPSRAYVAT